MNEKEIKDYLQLYTRELQIKLDDNRAKIHKLENQLIAITKAMEVLMLTMEKRMTRMDEKFEQIESDIHKISPEDFND
jgi:predicted  nucleic acid-binding Zn-ribbon protein